MTNSSFAVVYNGLEGLRSTIWPVMGKCDKCFYRFFVTRR